ncbi:rho-associated protein kinase 1-like [Leptopilina heterotoma]|uniref:rho-associated protein kinase 1-like n=1 Tax=Leptopilina heterotoma TaxID=63436 RepID=UPI001CA800C9|nr:rho-associated protein kinase 1-like [Leptopilina heterotoma]
MLGDKIMESETDIRKPRMEDHNLLIQEYADIVESLKEELDVCKNEQIELRRELEILRTESKNASDIARDCFVRCQSETCSGINTDKEILENLEKRIVVLQMEKDSMFQLWQMSLKAIDVLEEELKTFKKNGKGSSKFNEDHVNSIKQSYSDAINLLEGKLIQAKENFMKHQILWESNKEKFEELKKDKEELQKKISLQQHEILEKERINQKTVETLNLDLNKMKNECEKLRQNKIELERKLSDAQRFATNVLAKDCEAKNKVCEAIDLVESAVREKEMSLQRETRILDEKMKLEVRLNNIAEEYKISLEKEVNKVKEEFDRNIKKYYLELKELKVEMKQKETLLDRAQRECRLLEEEINKMRQGSDDYLHQSNSRILDLEQKLKDSEYKLKDAEYKLNSFDKIYKKKNEILEQRINEIQKQNLSSSHDLFPEGKIYRDFDNRSKSDESLNRYLNLEKRFERVLDEKENLSKELHTLQAMFDREMQIREQDKRQVENKVSDLQEDLRKATNTKNSGNEKRIEEISNVNTDLRLKMQQEKFEEKSKELTQLVEIHQQLSSRWKNEAKTLTSKFQTRSKELRSKINALRKENDNLNKELLSCRENLARYRVQAIHRYDHGDENR